MPWCGSPGRPWDVHCGGRGWLWGEQAWLWGVHSGPRASPEERSDAKARVRLWLAALAALPALGLIMGRSPMNY